MIFFSITNCPDFIASLGKLEINIVITKPKLPDTLQIGKPINCLGVVLFPAEIKTLSFEISVCFQYLFFMGENRLLHISMACTI